MSTTSRTVETSPTKEAALTNCIYVHPEDPLATTGFAVGDHGFVFTVLTSPLVRPGHVCLNNLQRKMIRAAVRDDSTLRPFTPPANFAVATSVQVEIKHFVLSSDERELGQDELAELRGHMRAQFAGQIFTLSQQIVVALHDKNYRATIIKICNDDGELLQARVDPLSTTFE
jgi:vesicle-fusing ATPase